MQAPGRDNVVHPQNALMPSPHRGGLVGPLGPLPHRGGLVGPLGFFKVVAIHVIQHMVHSQSMEDPCGAAVGVLPSCSDIHIQRRQGSVSWSNWGYIGRTFVFWA